jgi:NADH dehydrogenase
VILVTGGTGFVGPRVVHAIRAAGKPVRALVRNPSSRQAHQLRAWGCELATGDVTRPETLTEALADCEAVVHLVAIIRGSRDDFRRIMTDGTRDLVRAAEEAGVRRLVLMSALGTSERTKDLVPYYRAKWDMETVARRSSLEHVVFRPSFVFGEDGGALQQFRRIARLAPVTPIVGPGTQRLQPIWVDDVAAYFAAALDRPDAAGRTFELGGPDVVTWNAFWAQLKRAVGSTRRPSVHVPFAIMRAQAVLLERLPRAPVTRDQLTMLAAGDNVVSNDDALRTFTLRLVPLAEQLRRGT